MPEDMLRCSFAHRLIFNYDGRGAHDSVEVICQHGHV